MIHSAYRAALAAMILGAAGCGSSEPSPAVPLATATPDEPPAQDETGQLAILCNPPTPVLVDGKPAGTTPISAFRVPPGSHDVTFVDELTGNRTMTVKIGPGEGQSVVSDRPPNAVNTPEAKPEKPGKKKP